MHSQLQPADRQFLQRLHRLGGGTVQDICDDLGVTATAVRQRLVRLQSMGLIDRDAVREGRGRPYYIYEPTEAGLKEIGENYAELAKTLWRAVGQIESREIRSLVLEKVRDELVRRFGKGIRADELVQRFRELKDELADQGFDVEVDTTGALPILRENNCPYLDLANEDSAICELEQAVFAEVLGTPVKLSQCCLEGSNCCEFEVDQKEPVAVD